MSTYLPTKEAGQAIVDSFGRRMTAIGRFDAVTATNGSIVNPEILTRNQPRGYLLSKEAILHLLSNSIGDDVSNALVFFFGEETHTGKLTLMAKPVVFNEQRQTVTQIPFSSTGAGSTLKSNLVVCGPKCCPPPEGTDDTVVKLIQSSASTNTTSVTSIDSCTDDYFNDKDIQLAND